MRHPLPEPLNNPKAIDSGQTVNIRDMLSCVGMPYNLLHIKCLANIPSFAIHSHNAPMYRRMAQIAVFLWLYCKYRPPL